LRASSITKLCVVGVLLTSCVLPSLAAEAESVIVHPQVYSATAAQIEALENFRLVSLKRVHFSAGQSDPNRSQKATLEQIAKTLSERTATIIELRGYSDGASSPEANIALSVERAIAIARFLAKHHVARERILILGLGEVDPTSPVHRADCQRVDARVFVPPTSETSVRHESGLESFIQYTWGGKIEP
jgi:outer membrane protein OmpA-like peptidoglycan-associated protein